jgi:hypothetical protein
MATYAIGGSGSGSGLGNINLEQHACRDQMWRVARATIWTAAGLIWVILPEKISIKYTDGKTWAHT